MTPSAHFPCSFRIGQKVICIDATGGRGTDWYGDPPVEGGLYTIRGMRPTGVKRDGVEIITLYFKEISRIREVWSGLELGYWHYRFRALEERKDSAGMAVLRGLLKNPKRKVSAPEGPMRKEKVKTSTKGH